MRIGALGLHVSVLSYFQVAIAPLGVESAIPCTLILSLSFLRLLTVTGRDRKLDNPQHATICYKHQHETLAIFLLLINGAAAMYGGWSLMTDSSGIDLGLPADWIFRIPFPDFFIPGMILFLL